MSEQEIKKASNEELLEALKRWLEGSEFASEEVKET